MSAATKRPYRITLGYLIAVGLIYGGTSIAWLVLGAVTDSRTWQKDQSLRSAVGRLWGGVHHHVAPTVTLPAEPVPPSKSPASPSAAACGGEAKAEPEAGATAGAPGTPPTPDPCSVLASPEAQSTDARVRLGLEHRRKGLLWYSTYTVQFDGAYGLDNPTGCGREAKIWIPFPASGVAYDEFQAQLDGHDLPIQIESERSSGTTVSGAVARVPLAPGARHALRVRYKSRGMDQWNYAFASHAAQVRNFKLTVSTDFDKVDFPPESLSPTQKRKTSSGWELSWQFGNLLSDAGIGVTMPQRINPGPLAAEIAKFAPVSLAFFFFLLLLLTTLRQVPLHPVHYTLLAAAFFAFHLLFAYSVDLMPLWLAFSLASVVSVGLVISYLRLAVGPKFALLWAGGAQLLYLVLFSLAFFFEGYTGITITVFSISTLFAVMQLTGRIDWVSRLGKPPAVANTVVTAASGGSPLAGVRLAEPQEAHVFTRVV
jgi:hypothetical protein